MGLIVVIIDQNHRTNLLKFMVKIIRVFLALEMSLSFCYLFFFCKLKKTFWFNVIYRFLFFLRLLHDQITSHQVDGVKNHLMTYL